MLAAKRAAVIAAAVALALVTHGCAENAMLMRLTTYPPEFRYISDDELESVMWRLAGRVHELEQLTEVDEPDVAALMRALERIRYAAGTLDSDGGGSNHPYLQTKLQVFLGTVSRAEHDLKRYPPVIVTADDVWRACAGCHSRS